MIHTKSELEPIFTESDNRSTDLYIILKGTVKIY